MKSAKQHRTPSHFTNHLVSIAVQAIIEELENYEDREPLNGDETEAIGQALIQTLNEREGNK